MEISWKKILMLNIFFIALFFIMSSSKVLAFEKDIKNSTGFVAISNIAVKSNHSTTASTIEQLEQGTPFRILEEYGNWWKILYDINNNKIGWVPHAYCMINLPDVEPNIVYDITNAYSSIYKSSGYNLDITGTKLYKSGKVWNERLGRNEYIVPVAYRFAKKISEAQRIANAYGYCLVINDAYRPASVSNQLYNSLLKLYNSNSTVKQNINYDENGNMWGITKFVAKNISKHNTGSAIDVSIIERTIVGKSIVKMPSAMHELSTASIKYKTWESTEYSDKMTFHSKALDVIFNRVNYKLQQEEKVTALASEWWHFQDNAAHSIIAYNNNQNQYGNKGCTFEPDTIYSVPTSTPAPTPTPDPTPNPTPNTGDFERDIVNATGFAAKNGLEVKNSNGNLITTLQEGTPFRILKEEGDWWRILYDVNNNRTGWVQHKYCMINLPDVEPSIVYYIASAEGSVSKTSGLNIPGITGEVFYNTAKVWNSRLDRYEYIVPVAYSFAKKVAIAQRRAEALGYNLKIYDGYRPHSVTVDMTIKWQRYVYSDAIPQQVKNYIDYHYINGVIDYESGWWGPGKFFASSVSSHNTGSAIDVTLVRKSNGQELQMPTAMHESSTRSIKYKRWDSPKTPANYSVDMNANSITLDELFMGIGVNTMASEWWHFADNETHARIKSANNGSGCDFQVSTIYSTK